MAKKGLRRRETEKAERIVTMEITRSNRRERPDKLNRPERRNRPEKPNKPEKPECSGPDPCWLGSDFTAIIPCLTRNQFASQQREGSWQKVVPLGGRGESKRYSLIYYFS